MPAIGAIANGDGMSTEPIRIGMLSVVRRAFFWFPPLLYMAAIFHFSSESQPLPALTEHVWDKLLHLTEYAGLGFLWCRALRSERLGWPAATALAVLASIIYGASDEWHQSFVPLRDSSIRDWFADALGGSVGAAAYCLLRIVSTVSRRPHPPRR
jgi:VanZ family protein